jgi:sugar lactone lactonase YvrE
MRLAGLGLLVPLLCAFGGGSARVHVTIVGKRPAAVAERPWTVRLAVRPASFRGEIQVTAAGARRIRARARNRRVRLVFPSAGTWRLTARAAGSTSRLGTVRVSPARRPVVFSEPTSIELEPAGTLLVVENNPGRVLRVDPRDGKVTVLVAAMTQPYAITRTQAGQLFVSTESRLQRLDPSGPVTVAVADSQIGPVAAAPNGDVYYTTATQVFRLAGGASALVAQGFSNPHGLAFAVDGALLVSDTGHDRIARVAAGAVTTFAQVAEPRGLDVAADGSVYVVAGEAQRVVHLAADGSRLGLVGPLFDTPYDVQAAAGNATYVLEAGPTGHIRRVAADGTVTTVSRRR